MRKYNDKTKKTMVIILISFVGIIVIFSLFLKKAIDVGKTAYKIASSSVLFDKDMNMITTNDDSVVRVKWGGDYYLIYRDKEYDLGTHSVIYQSNSGDITLYGKYYEVSSNGDVNTIKGENKIKSSVNSKFYKLSDRKYLIIDRTIESKNSSFVTSNYLIVNLDKLGNATLLNDKTSFKTIVPTVLRTSSYTFDIANEKLNFGGEDIDLKKIIGSTNEYDEETYNLNAVKSDEDSDGTGGNGTGTNGNSNDPNGRSDALGYNSNYDGTTMGTNSDYTNNYSDAVSDEAVQEIIKATKNTSVIRVTSEINTISIDYVVYDPDNEYKSVYVEVENTSTSRVNTVFLSKTDTNILIRDLTPNVFYNLTFKYTYYDSAKTLKEYVFDQFGIRTAVPKVNMSVVKFIGKKLYYKISLDRNYTVTGGMVSLYLNDQFTGVAGSIPAKGNVSVISGNDCYLDLSDVNITPTGDNILSVRLVNLSFNTYTVNPGASYNFRY